ncbi:uncharacterized protein LOC127711378 [Mytilus californianus]|uniref:uncharacterized protein LOC127711378 n=1 Tax=Mytilus californianus TaxID=6549 RepID=UPI002247AC72|nr:uncharacterized protein LOC127711378 [Mytilus californianus]
MSMASVNPSCHLCEEEDVSNVAVVWCTDCETFLCKDCERHHIKSKASKRHQTLALDNYKKLPSFIVEIKSRCEKHDAKYDFYCKFHGDPCCVKCIKDKHKDCRDLDPLVEVLKNIKTSAKVSNLDKEFNNLHENFETVVKYLNFRTATLEENKTESLQEIRNLRASINKHLDDIEKKLVDDLSVEFNKIRIKYDNLTSEMEDKKKSIQHLQNDFSKMTLYAADLQIYLGLQYLEKLASEEVEFLLNFQRKGQLEEIRLGTKLSADLKDFANTIKTFGTAITHSSPSTFELKTSGECQANISFPQTLTIDEITPTLTKILIIPKQNNTPRILGCQILPNGNILVLDKANKQLLLFSRYEIYSETVLIFEGDPNDICYIKGNLIAVTFHRLNQISLLDISTKRITKTILVDDNCFGIDSNGEILIVKLLGRTKSVFILDLEGNILSKVNVPADRTIRIALCKDSIVCTDWKDNLVSCYTKAGVLLWKHKHEDICEPFGITVDKNGFIYVACKRNDKIVVLSEDGKTSRTILSKDNGIVAPHAINIDKTSSTLLVTNCSNDDVFVFEI